MIALYIVDWIFLRIIYRRKVTNFYEWRIDFSFISAVIVFHEHATQKIESAKAH